MQQAIGLLTGGAEGAGDAQDPSRTIASERALNRGRAGSAIPPTPTLDRDPTMCEKIGGTHRSVEGLRPQMLIGARIDSCAVMRSNHVARGIAVLRGDGRLSEGTAVDKQGKTVDFLLRRDRGIAAAQAFFRKALATNPTRWPRKVTLDGHTPSHRALRLLGRENPKWKYVEVRSCKYLNNIVEQDHRAIKRRSASMKGFKSFTYAAITIAGIELAHRIHKRQFSFGLGRPRRNRSLKVRWQRALA